MPTKFAVPLKTMALAALGRLGTPSQKAEAMGENPLWEPYPDGPQQKAIQSPADIVGYGGSAGGGKTDFLLGLALTEHKNSIIFRREYPTLRGMIQRSREIVGNRGKYNKNESTWMLDDGRILEFGAVQYEDDKEKFRGRPHDFIGYDEVTELSESIVRFLMGWLRTTVAGQRCRVAMTFNPPTHPRQRWIIDFFGPWLDKKHTNPAVPGEIRWFAQLGDTEVERPDGEPFEHEGETLYPSSRTFFPARLKDNPILAETGYARTLMALPEPLRSQLLRGDFDIETKDDEWQVIPTAWVEAANRRWLERGGDGYQPPPLDTIGLDIAHGGTDNTVLSKKHHDWFPRLLVVPGVETPDAKSGAKVGADAFEPGAYINVDAIGWGAGAAEKLADSKAEGGYALPANAINVASSSDYTDVSGKLKMWNIRAEMYWRLRVALDPDGEEPICLPPDPTLLADLTAPTYEVTPRGIKIESKDDIKERLKRSPDRGDAVALAMLPPNRGGKAMMGGPDRHGQSPLSPQTLPNQPSNPNPVYSPLPSGSPSRRWPGAR